MEVWDVINNVANEGDLPNPQKFATACGTSREALNMVHFEKDCTPLMYCIQKNYYMCITRLLSHGADVRIQTSHGTALDMVLSAITSLRETDEDVSNMHDVLSRVFRFGAYQQVNELKGEAKEMIHNVLRETGFDENDYQQAKAFYGMLELRDACAAGDALAGAQVIDKYKDVTGFNVNGKVEGATLEVQRTVLPLSRAKNPDVIELLTVKHQCDLSEGVVDDAAIAALLVSASECNSVRTLQRVTEERNVDAAVAARIAHAALCHNRLEALQFALMQFPGVAVLDSLTLAPSCQDEKHSMLRIALQVHQQPTAVLAELVDHILWRAVQTNAPQLLREVIADFEAENRPPWLPPSPCALRAKHATESGLTPVTVVVREALIVCAAQGQADTRELLDALATFQDVQGWSILRYAMMERMCADSPKDESKRKALMRAASQQQRLDALQAATELEYDEDSAEWTASLLTFMFPSIPTENNDLSAFNESKHIY